MGEFEEEERAESAEPSVPVKEIERRGHGGLSFYAAATHANVSTFHYVSVYICPAGCKVNSPLTGSLSLIHSSSRSKLGAACEVCTVHIPYPPQSESLVKEPFYRLGDLR